MTDYTFYRKFYAKLKKEIERKYKNKYLNISHNSETKFGLYFGIKNVSNDYRVRLKKNPGVKMHIVVDNKYEKQFFDYLKSNINILENDVGKILELKQPKENDRYKQIILEYSCDLKNETEEKLAICTLSSDAILLMESVIKLHEKFIK